MSHLKHGSDGTLLHGPTGNLVRACGGSGDCPCPDPGLPCTHCPDTTPVRFHVTFADVVLCPDCVNCADAGVSLEMSDDAVLDGTYVLTRNGSCAWTAFSTDVPCSASLYGGEGCSGDSTPVDFAIQQVRINDTQWQLQVTDASNTIVLFNAIIDAAHCCAGYTVANGLTACGCETTEDETIITMATGGSATVTPC